MKRTSAAKDTKRNVWLQLGFPDAEEHYLKAELVLRLDKAIKALRLTQRVAARRIGTTQPELSKILGGKFSEVSFERLLRFLWEHKHHSPFEQAGMTVEVQAPIFVFREWHRHRTQSYNELSARYTALPDLVYVPSLERIMAGAQAATNKQASEEGIDGHKASLIQGVLEMDLKSARAAYTDLLQMGLARELARLVIPVAQYSRMRASANLRNWLAFLTLRAAPGAQWEIQQYAFAVARIVADKFPRTYALWVEAK